MSDLDYVIDANVLISMLISGSARYQSIAEIRRFSTPSFALVEIEKYKDTIFQKSHLSENETRQYGYRLFSKITVCPDFTITATARSKAETLAVDIDAKDTDYLALAIQLDQILLTRDKPLFTGLRKKGFRQVMMFDEFLSGI